MSFIVNFFFQKAIAAQKIDLREVDREILGTTDEKKTPESPPAADSKKE